jgi:hypothetical protein
VTAATFLLLFFLALVCLVPAAQAQSPCDAACGTKAGKWFLNGHLEAGFFANAYGKTNVYNPNEDFRVLPGNNLFLQNVQNTGGQINQIYLSTGKAVDGRCGLDIGGTVDFTWGTDAATAQADGLESNTGHGYADWGSGDYSAALAQVYAEIAYYRWNVKIGKFMTPFGSNSYTSTDNFFYSWATTSAIVPFTASGAYATYSVNDKLAVFGGWIMPEAIGESSRNNAILGGFDWTPGERLHVRYAAAIGKNTYGYEDGKKDQYSYHSLVATTQITKKWKYIFDWTYGDTIDKPDRSVSALYGLNNEIIYQYNSKWSFGTRLGMFHTSDSSSNEDDGSGDWYTFALGANWTPRHWLIVKPEIRYDWVKNDADADDPKPFGRNDDKAHQFSGGISAVVKF